MKENYLEALKWYGKAADMGNAEAKYKIGKILWEEGKRYLQEIWEQGKIAASELIKEKQIGISYEDCIVFCSTELFSISADKRWKGIIEYSLDKINWYNWDGEEIKSYIIYMRGYGNTEITGAFYHEGWRFETKDKLICRGNIEALLNYKLCANGEHPPMSDRCYRGMFKGCTSLVEAPALPATKLAKGCYNSMFEGCTSLKDTPVLPATELADSCYYSMFEDCTSLVEAPALPATELADSCYKLMFSGCTSLVEAPALPATELAMLCYYGMFEGCISLKDRSNLPKSCFE